MLVAAAAALAVSDRALLAAAAALGTFGMLLDSLLGSGVQGKFRCPACDEPSERRRHRCGTRTELVGGWRWLDNDAVNAVVTVVAGLGAAALWSLR